MRVTVLSVAMLVPAAETARGVVFEDLNGDGQHQDSEPGAPGVTVSNGIDVVDTDADGFESGDTSAWSKTVGP